MTAELPERAERALDTHEAFDRIEGDDTDERWYAVTTTLFDGRVTVEEEAEETGGPALAYTLEVRTPMLSTATDDEVGPAVEEGWFETFQLRLEDAPMAVPRDVGLESWRVFEEAGDAVAVFTFRWADPVQATEIAKALAEYVEGTYVEGVVPGYEYEPPVSELLARASHDGDESGRGPMPL